MYKRGFLAGAAAALAVAPGAARAAAQAAAAGPALLTLSGAVGRVNRGPLDPVRDQMMVKHGIRFAKAFAFDAAALGRLAPTTIRPTLEYDGRVHELTGPAIDVVLAAAGVAASPDLMLGLRAVDGYLVALGIADTRRYGMIVATHLDGAPLDLGGLGPQWAVYEADTLAPFKDKPLKERFGLCPWGLYHIAVGVD